VRRDGDRWIIRNPYQDVVWDGAGAWNSYRSNLHTHTNESDGRAFPHEIMEYYATTAESAYPYNILAITDHDRVTWPWSSLSRPDEGRKDTARHLAAGSKSSEAAPESLIELDER
jgi:hypothetical protein